jgi:putative ABC transport system permease protein
VLADLGRASSVRAAAFSTFVTGGAPVRYSRESDPPQMERVAYGGLVTPDWFAATGATFIAGNAERFVGGSAVVNRALAAAVTEASTGAAMGARLRLGSAPARYAEIVGVVPDTLRASDGTPLPMLFLPMPAVVPPTLFLIVRATDVTGGREAIRAAVTAADPSVPIVRLETLDQRLSQLSRGFRSVVSIAAGIGLVSIGLAGAGLHSLLSYTVRRRKREIGIRVALGARTNEIVWLVTAPVMWLVSAGAAAGLAAAFAIAALIRSAMLGASSIDAWGLLPSIAILLGVALMAAFGPIYHATRVDPIRSLREE